MTVRQYRALASIMNHWGVRSWGSIIDLHGASSSWKNPNFIWAMASLGLMCRVWAYGQPKAIFKSQLRQENFSGHPHDSFLLPNISLFLSSSNSEKNSKNMLWSFLQEQKRKIGGKKKRGGREIFLRQLDDYLTIIICQIVITISTSRCYFI
jgi:hypothetical protein